MTKQYFSTLLKRVGVSSLIGMAVLLLVVACPAPSPDDNGDNGGRAGTPPTPPTISNVTANDDGGTAINFIESSDLYFKYTLITAKSTSNGGHTVTATVPRGNMGSVTLYGLKAKHSYKITLQAVSKDGTPSVVTDDNKGDVTKSVIVKLVDAAARKTAFLGKESNGAGGTQDVDVKKTLGIVPKLDKNTSPTSIKVVLTTIPSLAGIVKIDVLAVDADVSVSTEDEIENASKDNKKSVLKEVKNPKSGADVLLKSLKVAKKTGGDKGKVKVFYRLYDVNEIVSNWISTGGAVKPVKLSVEITKLDAKVGDQSITAITWVPVALYKTFIQIVNTDTGRKVAEHTFIVGIKGIGSTSNATKKIVVFPPAFKALKGMLYGTGTYEITAKAVKNGIFTKGVTKKVTVEDAIGPSGKKSPASSVVDIVFSIKNVGGRTLEVRIDAQPFEPDYAKTVIGVFVKEEGTAAKAEATEYKVITLHKGTMSEQFEGDKNGVYTAVPIFYDIMGNRLGSVTLAITARVTPVTLAAINKKPTIVEAKIKAPPTAVASTINDGQVTVTWELADERKKNQVKEWTVTPLQYAKAGTGSLTHVSAKAKTVKGTKRKVTFYDLPLDKQYSFEVKGKDNWDLVIVAKNTAGPKLALKARVPAKIAAGKVGAYVGGQSSIKGTLVFGVGTTSSISDANTTDIELTLKKDGTVVKGYTKKLYRVNTVLKPLAPSTKYTAELRAYSSVTGKFSGVKKVGPLTVIDGSSPPTAGIPAAAIAVTDAKATSFSLVANSWANLTDASKKAETFGKHYDASSLEDAKFELYYAKHGVAKATVTVGNTTTPADIAKVVAATSDKKDAGKIAIANKAGLAKIDVEDLERGKKYRIFIRTVNDLVTVTSSIKNYVDGTAKDVPLSTSPVIKKSTVSAVPNKNEIKVRVAASTEFGNAKMGGASLNAGGVEYLFYYVKDGYTETVNSIPITVDSDTTDNVIMSLESSEVNNANRGKTTLTTGSNGGVGATASADKTVGGLLASTKYYWFVRVQETAAADNGSNSTVGSLTTNTGAVAADSVPLPVFSVTAGDNNTKTKFTIQSIKKAVVTSAKKADGEAVNGDATTDVEYKLYYASSATSLTATQVKDEALKAVENTANNGGVATATVGRTVVVAGKTFVVAVYAVVESIIKSDPTKTTLSGVAKYTISQATAPASTPPPDFKSGSKKKSTGFELEWDDAVVVNMKKYDGAPLLAGDVTYKIYYASLTTALAGNTVAKVKTVMDAAIAAEATTNNKTGGKGTVTAGATKELVVTLKEFVGKVYIIVEAINSTDISKTVRSTIVEYTVPTAPGKVTSLSADAATRGQLTFKGVAPTVFGKKADGNNQVTGNLVYTLYYARVGYSANTVTVSATTTAEDVIKAVGDGTHANVGKIVLADVAVEAVVGSLTVGSRYRYTIVAEYAAGDVKSIADAVTSDAVQ